MIRFLGTTILALAGAVVVGVLFLAILLLPRQHRATADNFSIRQANRL